ncbi:MAG: oxalate/formate antiport family MFS transporter [Sulfobacillus benefaciens]|uniref:Oxalate/formate antiport family MFS transporter n=1 Tax=Sulfobacillus benefaciens TaxID=453960 RepID=A0A2T2WXF0_9FIRM|nr:MAG: oxalate/formate antiport family MFS transporter [Sulfobacillus benefaciens]
MLVLRLNEYSVRSKGDGLMTTAAQDYGTVPNRWVQAVLALIIMLFISPYEYTFTLFESPIAKAHHWALPGVALTFTIYVLVASFFMIPSGFWSDRWQPRWFTTVAGAITGLGWIMSAHAQTLPELYLAYGIGSLGPGYIYANSVNNALKWFPEAHRRGLAVGLIDMGFGAGSALFIPFLAGVIKSGPFGYQTAFTEMGIAMIVVIVIVAQFLHYPQKGWLPEGFSPELERQQRLHSRVANATQDLGPRDVLKTWQFWLAWIGMALITAAGLMVTAHIVDMAKVDVLVAGAVVGVAAATLSRIPNGLMRWVAGIVSDYIGRELSMLIAFVICGLSLFFMAQTHNGTLFIILAMVAMGTWGPLFTLFPALVGDYFGRPHSGINYGMLYTAKGIGGVFAGFIAAAIFHSTHSWTTDFDIAAVFAIVAGIIGIFLKPPGTRLVHGTRNSHEHSSAAS